MENKIEIILDHRFAPQRDPQISYFQWNEFLKHCEKEGWGHYCLTIEKDNPHWYEKSSGPFFKKVKEVLKSMNQEVRSVIKLGCTEAGFFAKRKCEVVTFGPGRAYGNAHQPNESVPVKELENAVVFYRELIRRMCF